MTTNHILVVDEDDEAFHSVADAFRAHYQVLHVAHGESALAFCESDSVAIAFISQRLPDMDGLAVLRRMRVVARTTMLIFMAEKASKELILAAFRAGAGDFIEKPVTVTALSENLDRWEISVPMTRSEAVQRFEYAEPAAPHGRGRSAFWGTMKRWLRQSRNFLHNVRIRLIAKHASTSHTISLPSFLPAVPQTNLQDAKATAEVATVAAKLPNDESNVIVPLRVHCLGRFQVFIMEQPIEHWPSRKGRNLFAYLAFQHKHRIYRDVLMEIFWPSSTPDAARNSLHVTIHSIRSHLRKLDPGREYILYHDECYCLNSEVEMWLDVEDFLHYSHIAQTAARDHRHREAIENYELAAALYQGELMADEPYEAWPAQQRESLKETYLTVLDHLSDSYRHEGHPDAAIRLCERILSKDNCREEVYRRLMQCYCEMGQRDKALRVFQQCTEVLFRELEAKPTHATIQLYEQIKNDNISRTSRKQ